MYKNPEKKNGEKISAINAIIHYESSIIQISVTIAVGIFISLFVAILSLLKGSATYEDIIVCFLLIFSLPGLWTFLGFLVFLFLQAQKAARLSESLQFFIRGEINQFK